MTNGHDFTDGIARTANKALATAGGQWLMEVLCFYFTFVLTDSLVLRNARHRQAPKTLQEQNLVD